MKILILHNINDIKKTRRTTLNFSFALLKYAPEHEYYLHCYQTNPVTDELFQIDFDVIILDVTFLDVRYSLPKATYRKFLETYQFIKNSNAIKLAFPQDEYYKTKFLEEAFKYWNVQVVYSLCPRLKEVYYPSIHDKTTFFLSLTGYVDKYDVETVEKHLVPFEQRSVDIGYRAIMLNPGYGKFGQLKNKLDAPFKKALSEQGITSLKIDSSCSKSYQLLGDDWLKFLCNSKFTLGCESGSSIYDPEGDIRTSVQNYISKNPEADFEEVSNNCFTGEDGKYLYNAISPRIFETAIARSCQILIEGDYSGLIQPWKHYIPLKEDFSDIEEVVEVMKNTQKVKEIIDCCYEDLIQSNKYTYKSMIEDVLRTVNDYKQILIDNTTVNKSKVIELKKLTEIITICNYEGQKKGFSHFNDSLNYPTLKQKYLLLSEKFYKVKENIFD